MDYKASDAEFFDQSASRILYIQPEYYGIIYNAALFDSCQDMLDYVSENSGEEIDFPNAWKIRDPLFSEVKIT